MIEGSEDDLLPVACNFRLDGRLREVVRRKSKRTITNTQQRFREEVFRQTWRHNVLCDEIVDEGQAREMWIADIAGLD